MIVAVNMTVEVRIPSDDRVTWTPEKAATAIGKPFLDETDDGEKIGEVVAADVVDGDLVMTIEIVRVALVGFDLKDEEVRCVALGPRLPSVVT